MVKDKILFKILKNKSLCWFVVGWIILRNDSKFKRIFRDSKFIEIIHVDKYPEIFEIERLRN